MGIVSLSGVISTLLSVATGSDQVDDMGRIVGGFTSEKGAYPFFVRIDSSEGLSKCGGSLIAPDIVLTAAHCKKETTESFQVAVNGYAAPFVTNDDAVYLSVLESLQHPDFVPETYHNDFMVLKLEAAVDLNLMTPVQLNQASILPAQGELLRVVGLGVLREDGPTPNFLQEVEIPVIDTAPCKQAYANLNIDIVDDNVMFCMEDVGKDSCQGDSGGPVLNSSGFQVGVVSFGFGCAK
jgi:trypsin